MNYARWIGHFQANRLNRPEPDWNAPFNLPDTARCALAKSLAEYQLGDGGGECRLIARDANRVRGRCAEAALLIDLWFAEEREHSRLLTCAVQRLRGEFVRSTFAFRMFNRCRRLAGVDYELLVLLIVEIVSTGYYRLIERHCDDEPIAAMCRLIIRDEAAHIGFHRDRLAADGVKPGFVWRIQFWFLAHACAAFLWLGHGRFLRVVGGRHSELFAELHDGLRAFERSLARASDSDAQPQVTVSLAS
jgi:hypothetical protein